MKKMILLALAPLVMLGTQAEARTVVHRTVVYTNHGHHWRGRHHTRRVCKMEWRHHHRVRICRTVRWR